MTEQECHKGMRVVFSDEENKGSIFFGETGIVIRTGLGIEKDCVSARFDFDGEEHVFYCRRLSPLCCEISEDEFVGLIQI